VNQLVLSGTVILVLSRTRSSYYRGPNSSLSACFLVRSSPSNLTNQKSCGFLLTDQAKSRVGSGRQRCALSPACRLKLRAQFAKPKARGSQLKLQGASA
jgi:hypothetical protein